MSLKDDGNLFLPNIMRLVNRLIPFITAQQVINFALDAYIGSGGPLYGLDVDIARSDFVADLFDPRYWTDLHGNLSEPAGTLVTVGVGARTIPTADSDPDVCYTNIVGTFDIITGHSAGFQDPAPNVDNFTVTGLADHSTIMSHPQGQEKMFAALQSDCFAQGPGTPPPGDGAGPGTGTDGDDEGFGEPAEIMGGCASTRSTSWLGLVVVGLVAALGRRRRGATST